MRNTLIVIKEKSLIVTISLPIKISCLFTLWLCGLPLSLSGLGDFDNLHAEQLDFRLAILQHLLGCGQHLPILGSDNRSYRDTEIEHLAFALEQTVKTLSEERTSSQALEGKVKIYIYSQVHKYWDIDTILTFLALYTTTMDFKWNEQDVL